MHAWIAMHGADTRRTLRIFLKGRQPLTARSRGTVEAGAQRGRAGTGAAPSPRTLSTLSRLAVRPNESRITARRPPDELNSHNNLALTSNVAISAPDR